MLLAIGTLSSGCVSGGGYYGYPGATRYPGITYPSETVYPGGYYGGYSQPYYRYEDDRRYDDRYYWGDGGRSAEQARDLARQQERQRQRLNRTQQDRRDRLLDKQTERRETLQSQGDWKAKNAKWQAQRRQQQRENFQRERQQLKKKQNEQWN